MRIQWIGYAFIFVLMLAACSDVTPTPFSVTTLGGTWDLVWSDEFDYEGLPDATARERKVVRGGSWRDRPWRCTSSFRLGYAPYQGVYNVGFRVACERRGPSQE